MLQTTCPNCNAQFKVQPEQLNIRQGRVMCGRCRHVFNAFQFLERVTESIPLQQPVPAADPADSTYAKPKFEPAEFDLSVPLHSVQARADAAAAEQKANEDAFEESLNSIIEGQSSSLRARAGDETSSHAYAIGQTTTFGSLNDAKTQNVEPLTPVTAANANAVALAALVAEATPALAAPAEVKTLADQYLQPDVWHPDAIPQTKIIAPPHEAQAVSAMGFGAAAAPVTLADPTYAIDAPPAQADAPVKPTKPDLRFPHNAPILRAAAASAVVGLAGATVAEGAGVGLISTDPRSATNPLLEPLDAAQDRPAARRWVTALYSLGCITLLLTLGALCAYHFRNALVAQFPAHRGLALQACEKLNCVLPWSRNLDAVKIEASDLLEIPGKPGQLVLSATLANRSAVTQDYPLFEVMLTDNTNRTVTSRVFTPEQYLARALKPDEGFAPNTEIALTLNLDAGAKSLASGYNMQVVYQ